MKIKTEKFKLKKIMNLKNSKIIFRKFSFLKRVKNCYIKIPCFNTSKAHTHVKQVRLKSELCKKNNNFFHPEVSFLILYLNI